LIYIKYNIEYIENALWLVCFIVELIDVLVLIKITKEVQRDYPYKLASTL
jgi:hypothetical protein